MVLSRHNFIYFIFATTQYRFVLVRSITCNRSSTIPAKHDHHSTVLTEDVTHLSTPSQGQRGSSAACGSKSRSTILRSRGSSLTLSCITPSGENNRRGLIGCCRLSDPIVTCSLIPEGPSSGHDVDVPKVKDTETLAKQKK